MTTVGTIDKAEVADLEGPDRCRLAEKGFMNPRIACRLIAARVSSWIGRSATCRKESTTFADGKRVLLYIPNTKVKIRISRSESRFSLPTGVVLPAIAPLQRGKLNEQYQPGSGLIPLATDLSSAPQHLYIESDSRVLDKDQLMIWEKSEAANHVRAWLLWLVNRTDAPFRLDEIPTTWWQLAMELRATCSEEPDAFEFAYFIWSVLAEVGSTIDGI